MILFNIIGTGFLDFEDGGSLGFKAQNPHFRFCDISLDRSVEFTVPATCRNRLLLGFGEDVNEYGEMLRKRHTCQMVYDGGAALGTLAVTAYEGEAFKCVFYKGASDWLDKLQDLKLADCVTSHKGTMWLGTATPVDADAADPTNIVEIIKYDNGISGYAPNWQLVPSVNIAEFLRDIFTNMAVPFSSDLPHDFWMVTGSMNGSDHESLTLTQTDKTTASVSPASSLVDTINFDVEYATARVFGVYVGGGSEQVQGFKALDNIKLTLGTLPADVYLVKWSSVLKQCECLGGYSSGGEGEDISGHTIELKKGNIFFFADRDGWIITYDLILYGGGYFGWKDTAHPVSVSVTVARDVEMRIGDVWRLQDNMPDMTVFEFLESVALATGREVTVDPDTGVSLAVGSYGQSGDFKALENVISVDHVSRVVDSWGANTRDAEIVFDEEEYVTQPVVSQYPVPNENESETKESKSRFSTGLVGLKGVEIHDVKVESGNYKFAAKKWTIARVDASSINAAWLQRIGQPAPVAYDDISANSTCMHVKVAAEEAEFFALTPSTTFLWRGAAFVWTDADWSAGVMGLTLQRVSKQAGGSVTPPVMTGIVATFTQGGATIYDTDSLDDLKQYLVVTANYSDSSEAFVPSTDYVLSGSLVAPSSTITVTYNGFTDTFTVQVTHQSSVSDYVQDGLVLMLDGIEQGDEVGKWKDLVNGLVFTPTGGVTFEENCIALDGTGRLTNNSFVAPLANNGTIEVVFSKTSTSGMIFAPTGGSQKIAAGFFGSGLDWAVYSSKPRYPQINEGSISVNNNRCLYNGVAQTSNGNDYILTNTTTSVYVGARYNNGSYGYYITGKVHCIRIYNRQLTELEMLQNQSIDYQRFGIGYNP